MSACRLVTTGERHVLLHDRLFTVLTSVFEFRYALVRASDHAVSPLFAGDRVGADGCDCV